MNNLNEVGVAVGDDVGVEVGVSVGDIVGREVGGIQLVIESQSSHVGSENCSLRDSNSSSRSSSKQVQVYTGISGEVSSEKYNQSISEGVLSIKEMVELFEVVNSSGVPNFKKCRIRVPGSKNFDMSLWRTKLSSYEDYGVCDLLEFGFPLDFNQSSELNYDVRRNHKGARDFPGFINKYLERECKNMRVVGPFTGNPLSVPLMVSPINTVPKENDDERRVIVDLSWPQGYSVNDGISKDRYLGEVIELHYASVEEVCKMVLRAGPGSVIYKRDLRRAYRQIPVDPKDYRYLGYFWGDEFFFDTVLCMGQRNAALACSRATKAVMHIHENDGYHGTSYLDDLIGVAPAEIGSEAYESLGDLLKQLGLVENFAKACPPSTVQLVLGVLVDTVNGTLLVPDDKMKEINSLLLTWKRKRKSNKVDLQSLIGKLQFVSKCVRQSRIFLNRLLDTLRSFKADSSKISLSQSFKKDVQWWVLFMETYNGVSYIPPLVWDEPDVLFSTDSCLTGCGGICGLEYFHQSYPKQIIDLGLPIHALEMLAVLIGVRFWGGKCCGGKVQIFCDNEPVVHVLNTGKTKDEFLGSCLREIWLVVSRCGFEMRAVHLPGEENRVADWLSRWEVHSVYQENFRKFTGVEKYTELQVTMDMFKFSEKI